MTYSLELDEQNSYSNTFKFSLILAVHSLVLVELDNIDYHFTSNAF